MRTRLPAEWEEQDGVLLAWPHAESDWRLHLEVVEPVFIEIVRQVSRFEMVLITAPDPETVRIILTCAGTSMERVRLFRIDSNDTWARDFGPITVLENGQPVLLDFGFNGWGFKFAADMDNLISRRLAKEGAFSVPLRTIELILEGGSIESDGAGTILTTSACLLSPNRNPHLSRREIEMKLTGVLGADRFLWLESGHLAGDDTDSHVDTLARLCPDDTILHVSCTDPTDEHYPAIKAMVEELQGFRTRDDRPYRLIPLPWPQARHDEDGQRLPATYANFLVINGAVLVPTYGEINDDDALRTIGDAFPRRKVIGVDCRPLITQHGSLHCVTMQLPKGTIDPK
ncbi:MAG TPA: agmatine deiminase family protein [Geobacteraceae bacterium]|nr:agmatine deiminase family protein [Geobacteraceae bacterium]